MSKSNKPHILILGASFLQVPAIRKAKQMGFYVGVADYNRDAVGVTEADEFFNVSTIDSEGIAEVVRQFKPIGITTMATDMPMRVIAMMREQFGLAGPTVTTAEKCTDKDLMSEAFWQCGVPHPRFFTIHSEAELWQHQAEYTFPCVLKPIDASASRGVVLCNSLEELVEDYAYAVKYSKAKRIIIQEFVEGNEVSVEVFCLRGKPPHIITITDKITTGRPHFVEVAHSQPSRHTDAEQAEIKRVVCQAIKALGVESGPVHAEVMVTATGEAKMIELGHRLGGDFITSHLVPLSTGVDMVELTIREACGMPVEIPTICQRGSAVQFILPKQDGGVLTCTSGFDQIRRLSGVKEADTHKHIGDIITPLNSSLDRLGYVIAQADSAADAERICLEASSQIKYQIEVKDD